MNKPNPKAASYAFFDFDGTLIAKDSFNILLREGLKHQPWRIFLLIPFLPIFISTVVFHHDKSFAKSALLWALTFGRGKRGAIKFLKNAMLKHLDKIWFKEALPLFQDLSKQNVRIIVISASGQVWIRAALQKVGAKVQGVIGTRLEFFLWGVILKSKNCYEEEKLLRISEDLGDEFTWHSSYSDHTADLPLLKMAPKRFIICPKKTHLEIFKKELNQDFELYHWTTQQ